MGREAGRCWGPRCCRGVCARGREGRGVGLAGLPEVADRERADVPDRGRSRSGRAGDPGRGDRLVSALLLVLLALPALTALVLWALPPTTGDRLAASIGSVVSGLVLVGSAVLWWDYNRP